MKSKDVEMLEEKNLLFFNNQFGVFLNKFQCINNNL